MGMLDQLSSQVGNRNQAANERAAERCLEDPTLLEEIAQGLRQEKADLLGDCAEVMTMVAERRPDLVSPYVDLLSALLSHKVTRVRWEAMHATALVADRVPEQILGLLPRLTEMLRTDKSIIVRDYAVDAVGNAAKAGESAARQVYPALRDAVYVWESRHVGHALAGLCNVVASAPALAGEVAPLGEEFADHSKGTVRKAAKALAKAVKQAESHRGLGA